MTFYQPARIERRIANVKRRPPHPLQRRRLHLFRTHERPRDGRGGNACLLRHIPHCCGASRFHASLLRASLALFILEGTSPLYQIPRRREEARSLPKFFFTSLPKRDRKNVPSTVERVYVQRPFHFARLGQGAHQR